MKDVQEYAERLTATLKVLSDLMKEARDEGLTVTMDVDRKNTTTTDVINNILLNKIEQKSVFSFVEKDAKYDKERRRTYNWGRK